MRLATDIITIAHGGNAVRLRPSLRAALHLQREHGLGKLARAVSDCRLGLILDIVAAGTDDDPCGRLIVIDTIRDKGVPGLASMRDAIDDFLAVSYGIDPDDDHPVEREQRKTGKFDLEKALVDLFEIGTGWLEWTPAETWAATPAEIAAAQRGLIAKLKAVHGSADDEQGEPQSANPDDWELSPEDLRENLDKLRAVMRRG